MVPSAYAASPLLVRRGVISGTGINPWRTWEFANGIPSIFKHNGTWSISGGKLINTPTLGTELLTNGGFDSDTWWAKGDGWSIGGGLAAKTTSALTSILGGGDATLTVGTFVRVTLDVVSFYGTIGIYASSSAISGYAPRSVGSLVVTNVAGGTVFRINGTALTICELDNASCRNIVYNTLPNLVDLRTPNASITAAVAALTSGTQAGILAHYIDENNFLYVVFDGAGNIKAVERIAGTYSANRLSQASAFSANDQLQVVSSGGTVTVKKNGTTIGSAFALNAALTSGTKFGLFSTYSGNQITSCTFAKA